MHTTQLISALLKANWVIEPNFAISHGPLVASLLNIQTALINEKPNPLTAFAIDAKDVKGEKYSRWDGFNNAPRNSVAVISLKGPLMKEDMNCGPVGMSTLGTIIEEADSHNHIGSIVLHIDSPGGTVDGTEALAAIVKNTKKPVVAFVDGLMASGAFWIGSAANEIIASTDTDQIGSVGVILRFQDMQSYWEAQGVKFHSIPASTSPDKNKMFEELREGNYDNYRKEVLDPIDEKFMNAIKTNCPACEEKHLTGKVFFARDVMNVFVNSIGTLGDAIARAHELSIFEEENSNIILKNTISMKQFKNLNTVLGLEALESVDESVSLNEEQLEVIEGALIQNDQAVANARTEAETERDAANDLLAAANNLLSNAIAAFDAIDPAIATAESPEAKADAVRTLLSSRVGVEAIIVVEENDPEAVKSDVDWDVINKLPHNIAVDANS